MFRYVKYLIVNNRNSRTHHRMDRPQMLAKNVSRASDSLDLSVRIYQERAYQLLWNKSLGKLFRPYIGNLIPWLLLSSPFSLSTIDTEIEELLDILHCGKQDSFLVILQIKLVLLMMTWWSMQQRHSKSCYWVVLPEMFDPNMRTK